MTTSMSRLHCYQIFAKPIGSHPCFVKTFCFFDRIWNAFRFSNSLGEFQWITSPFWMRFCCKGKFSQNWVPYLCIPLHWKDAPKMGNLMTPETCQDLGINFCCDSGTGSSGRWRTVGVPSTKPPESRQMFRRFTTQTQAFLLFCGRNPAPVDMEKLPLFTGLWLYLSQVVQDFFHQKYQSRSILTTLRRSFWEEIAEQNKNCTQIVQTMSLCFAFL